MTRRRIFTRDQFTTAAREIVQEQGASKLTFDAVGTKLDASRGAITHNFPTKRDLVVAMIDDMFSWTREIVEQEIDASRDGRNPTLVGMIRAIADVSGRMKDFSQGLFQAAVAEQPSVTEPFTQFYQDYWKRISEESSDPIRALMLWTSVEGLILMDCYEPSPYSSAQRLQLVDRLLAEASSF